MDENESMALRQHEDSISVSSTTQDIIINIFKGLCFFGIILTALFGNMLVLIAVMRFQRLRHVRTNMFLVSLALADFLVALLVMPFSAIMGLLQGKWIFGSALCDIFNANDVLFSTASILHLCCISTERYIAVLSPLTYERKMTRARIAIMLTFTWLLSTLISYVPILSGIYTTTEHQNQTSGEYESCEFVVNPYYALISSATSFWIPSFLMIAVYVRIFIEARNQERKIHKLYAHGKRYTSSNLQTNPLDDTQLDSDQIVAITAASETYKPDTRFDQKVRQNGSIISIPGFVRNTTVNKSNTFASNVPGAQEQLKIRRENKAAKTLGIIMGAFLLCWLPFFLWYTITNMCGGSQRCAYPAVLGEILFWIGYFNSTLNPIIYAFYNRPFRHAFKQILLCKRRWKSRLVVSEATKGNYMRRTNQQLVTANGNDNSPPSSRP